MKSNNLIADSTYTKECIEGEWTYYGTDTLVLKCIRGGCRMLVGSTECNFTTDMNFMLADGVLLKIMEASADLQIQTYRFSYQFFNVLYPMVSGEVIDTVTHSHPDLYDNNTEQMLDLLFNQLILLYPQNNNPYRYKMTINILVNYMLTVFVQSYESVKDKVADYPNDRKTNILCSFYEMCNNDAVNHRNIEYYADKLHITSRYLFRICKENSGLTPKQAIDFVIIGKAKKMLLTTMMTTQQITNELNFPDQSTFTQYFKRNVGMTPSEFRGEYK